MTQGPFVTIYRRGCATTGQCVDAACGFFADRPFVWGTDQPQQTKWMSGSNLSLVSYAADPERDLVVAMGVVDNLGKGAAGQAVQNANLICGLTETKGFDGVPVWPRGLGQVAPMRPFASSRTAGMFSFADLISGASTQRSDGQ